MCRQEDQFTGEYLDESEEMHDDFFKKFRKIRRRFNPIRTLIRVRKSVPKMLIRPMNPLNALNPIKTLIRIRKAVPKILVRPKRPFKPIMGGLDPALYIKRHPSTRPKIKVRPMRGVPIGSTINPRLVRKRPPQLPIITTNVGTKKGMLSKMQAKALYNLKKESGLATTEDKNATTKPVETPKPKTGWSTKKKVIIAVVAVVTTVGIGFTVYKMVKK